MAIEKFQTIRIARLYTKTGGETNLYVPTNTVLDCNWQWTTGTLLGMRKIEFAENPGYIGYFVKSVDLRLYTVPTPDPEPLPMPDEVQFRWKDAAGNVTVTREYVPK